MASEISGLRAQILANAKIMLRNPAPEKPTSLQPASSQSTLISSTAGGYYGNMDVVVFGSSNMYTAALMVGLTPAIEGDSAAAPESAMRKLLTSTAEMLACYIPKVGAHQRNIHGGGVFDEDLISGEILAQRR